MEIKGSVVLVTGSARGIGYSVAEYFARLGARIVLCDMLEDELKGAALKLAADTGAEVAAFPCNVTDADSVARLYTSIDARFGRVDVAVLNAGIIRDALLIKKNKETGELGFGMSLDQWNQVLSVNLTGVFLTGREAAVRMAKQGRGVIVPISSIARYGNMGQTNYSATKAGVVAMTVAWSKELARWGVRCAAVAPGFIGTEMVLKSMQQEAREKMEKMIPIGRIGRPDEIAHTVKYIVENEYLSGETIDVTGGMRL